MSTNETRAAVLVVEDEPLLMFEAVDFLEDEGFTVYNASNADEALREMEEHADIGVLFTDVQMPGSMNGLALARAVRDCWPLVNIIVTSGHVEISDDDLPAAGVYFFPKPYIAGHVVRQVKRMAAHF